MKLFVGLGNPGTKYARHRHNIGFMAVDEIIHRHSFGPEQKKFQGLLSEGRLGSEKVLALKPQTYMNESGRSVGEAMRFYKLDPEDVYVFYDELDLAAGKIRIKKGGGAAGHNGIRSTTSHIGADYWRVRLGIGHPGAKELVTGHVLGDFAKADQDWLQKMLEGIGQHADLLTRNEEATFANKVHLAIHGEPERNQKKKKTAPAPAQEPQEKQPNDQTPDSAPRKEGPMADMLKRLRGDDSNN